MAATQPIVNFVQDDSLVSCRLTTSLDCELSLRVESHLLSIFVSNATSFEERIRKPDEYLSFKCKTCSNNSNTLTYLMYPSWRIVTQLGERNGKLCFQAIVAVSLIRQVC